MALVDDPTLTVSSLISSLLTAANISKSKGKLGVNSSIQAGHIFNCETSIWSSTVRFKLELKSHLSGRSSYDNEDKLADLIRKTKVLVVPSRTKGQTSKLKFIDTNFTTHVTHPVFLQPTFYKHHLPLPYVSFPLCPSTCRKTDFGSVLRDLQRGATLGQLVVKSTGYNAKSDCKDTTCYFIYNLTLNMLGSSVDNISQIKDDVSLIVLAEIRGLSCRQVPKQDLVDIEPVSFPVYFNHKIISFMDGVKYSSVLTYEDSLCRYGCFDKVASNTWTLDGLAEFGLDVPDQFVNGTLVYPLQVRTLTFALVGIYSSIIGHSESQFVDLLVDQLAAEMGLVTCYFIKNVMSTNQALTVTRLDLNVTSYCGSFIVDLDAAVDKFRKRLMTRQWKITDASGFPNRILALESVRGLVLLGKYDDSQLPKYGLIISFSVLVTSVVYLEFSMFLKRRKKKFKAQFVRVAPAGHGGDLPGL